MTVKITKPKINAREELNDLKKPTGIAGEAMLRAETPQEQFNLIGAGRRNMIINGDMQVWQRSLSYTHDVTDASLGPVSYATVDRFKATGHSTGNSTAGVYTSTQEIYDEKIWLKNGCTTPYNGTSYIVRGTVHFIENVGTVSALRNKEVTLSYLFRAKRNGQYSVSVADGTDANFSIFSFDYTGAGESQHVSFTFTVPDTAPPSNKSLMMYFSYGVPAGHALISDETNLNGTFVSTSSMLTRDSDYKWWAVAGDWIAFTEVQLELGKVATPFERRPYVEELALCQRYYEEGLGYWNAAGGYMRLHMPFMVQKRAAPTINVYSSVGGTGLPTSGTINQFYQGGVSKAGLAATKPSKYSYRADLTNSIYTPNIDVYWGWTADAEL